MIHHRFPFDFIIKKGIHGVGVFISEEAKKGQSLFKLKGKILHDPTRTSVQIGKNEHIEDDIAQHMNHSCLPNARVNKKNRTIVSLRNISKGEEITFDYNKNEDKLATPFICSCCGRFIHGKEFAFDKKHETETE